MTKRFKGDEKLADDWMELIESMVLSEKYEVRAKELAKKLKQDYEELKSIK